MKERIIQFTIRRRRLFELVGLTSVSLFLEGSRERELVKFFLVTPGGYEGLGLRSYRLRSYLEKQPRREKGICFLPPLDGLIGQSFWEGHQAIDIAGSEGETVLAAANGIILEAGEDSEIREVEIRVENAKHRKKVLGLGKFVIIEHSEGLLTVYGHLSKFLVCKNDKVSMGEKIGEVGSTGRAFGSHLHFQIVKDGKNVNPLLYLDITCY